MSRKGQPRLLTGAMGLYLAELYRLGGEKGFVAPSALADALEVSPAAVARMVGRLDALGLVERRRYRGVRLTEEGRREALRVIRYHRLAEAFLVRVLDYGWHEAHDIADALAEIADETLVARMDEKAGHPRRCPHGEPIPTPDGQMPQIHDLPLADLEVGQAGIISRVRTRDEARLKYLAEVGLVPETPFRVEGRAPFGGPLRLRLPRGECVIGEELARVIYVEPAKEGATATP